MKYNDYKIGPCNLHIINTDKFKTVTLKVNFKRKCIKNEITLRRLLSMLLLESTKKYKTRRLLEIKTEDLYDLKYSSYNVISGNYNIMSFETTFLDEAYTEKGMFNESINFLFDIILNPNVKNNKFDKEQFNICKNEIKESIETIKEDKTYYSNIRLFEEMDNKAIISYRTCGYKEDLENITESSLYEYYKSMIKNDKLDIFIIGNINTKECVKIISNICNFNKSKKMIKKHYIEYDNYLNEPKIVKEKDNSRQTKLAIALKLNNLTDFEKKYVMGIYSYILGGGPDSKLFKEVREKNSLCYSISSNYSMVFSILKISAGINKKDEDKTLKLIKKEIDNISLGKFTNRDIKCAVLTYINSYKEIYDSSSSLLSSNISKYYLKLDNIEDREKNLNKVTKEMIMDVSKKIHMDTIYILEGNDD